MTEPARMDTRTRLCRLLVAIPLLAVLAWLIGGLGDGGRDQPPGTDLVPASTPSAIQP